jgi:CrcB protein
MTWTSFGLAVGTGLAGATGAVVRYGLGRLIAGRLRSSFPLGTLLINVSGALLIGLLFALTAKKVLSPALQLILATGFLGGYTTFSTLSWEGVQLLRGRSYGQGLLYLGGNILPGLLAAACGLLLGGLF